jgi:hypothetical protein
MKKVTIWYSCLESDPDCRYAARVSPGEFDDTTAIEVAEDYHSEHDGWESTWPLTFALYKTEEGPEVARYGVEREYDPHFLATKVVP